METKTKVRLSNIELLKIIALILIIFSHCLPTYGDESADSFVNIDLASNDFQIAMLSCFKYFGQIGNAIFIFCSAYFLVDSKAVKGRKILYIIFDAFIISVIFLCGFLAGGYKLSGGEIALQFIPITSRFNWFIGCYLILYAVHPLLNKIIHGTSKRYLLLFNIFLFVLYCVMEFVGGELLNMFYYTHLVGFICLYFFTGYVKLHMQNFLNNAKLQAIILAGSILGFGALMVATEFLGLNIGFFADKMIHWNEINNPFIIGMAISSFALFNKINPEKLKGGRLYCYISSLTLPVYMIHENKLFRDYIRPKIFQWIYENFSYKYLVGWCVLLVVVTFIVSIALAAVYKHSIGRLVRLVIDKCYPRLSAAGNKLLDKLESKD